MGYQNFFATRLATDIGASDNVLTLEVVPTVTSGTLVLEARNPTQREIVKYTGVAGSTVTGVTRGQGGTTAKTHTKNALVEMNVTAEDLTEALGLAFAFPTGIVLPYAGSIVPDGWLLCDGTAVSRATYDELFTQLSTTYGAGDGSTTFNLPDLRGKMPLGVGTGSITVSFASADVNTGTDQIAVPAHTSLKDGQTVTLTTTGTLPTGLAAATTYYIIVIDSTHIKLASSLTNALMMRTGIDITGAGSGTHTMTMALTARTLGEQGGREIHTHALSNTGASKVSVTGSGIHVDLVTTPDWTRDTIGTTSGSGSGATLSQGSGLIGSADREQVMPPYLGLNYIIKA